jgi:hypothetical protein
MGSDFPRDLQIGTSLFQFEYARFPFLDLGSHKATEAQA